MLLTTLVNDYVSKYTQLMNSVTKINEENTTLKIKLDDNIDQVKKTNEECAILRKDLDDAIRKIKQNEEENQNLKTCIENINNEKVFLKTKLEENMDTVELNSQKLQKEMDNNRILTEDILFLKNCYPILNEEINNVIEESKNIKESFNSSEKNPSC